MFVEHFVYSAALAILAGMVWYHYTGRDHSWIIIASALVPDLDVIANQALRTIGVGLLLDGHMIRHGTFHNIAFMVLFGIAMAFLLHPLGIRFLDSLVFATIGFGAHLIEDAFVFESSYPILWPLSSKTVHTGFLTAVMSEEEYIQNFFGIANSETLIIGLLLFLAAFLIRTWAEGSAGWVRHYLPASVYHIFFGEDRHGR